MLHLLQDGQAVFQDVVSGVVVAPRLDVDGVAYKRLLGVELTLEVTVGRH